MKKNITSISIVIIFYCLNSSSYTQQLNWDIITVPMIDSSFNSNKSFLDTNYKSNVQGIFLRTNDSIFLFQLINSSDIPIFNSGSVTHSENSVFISPLNKSTFLNSNNYSTWPTISNLSVSGQFSFNDGVLWPGVIGQLNSSRADPSVVIDLNGKFYVGYVDLSLGQSISFSSDNGQTWQQRIVALNPGYVADKNHLWIDNRLFKSDGSPNDCSNPLVCYEGNLYAAWTQFENNQACPQSFNDEEIIFVRSLDNGNNWSSPQNISSNVNAGCFNQGVNLQTGPNGEIYACWAIYDCWPCSEIAIGFTKSLDGGATWFPATRIIGISGSRLLQLSGGKNMHHNSFPVMAVNQQNGEIYIVWTHQVVMDDPDIFFIKSSDSGDTWDVPININQNNQYDQWFPWIACDEISGAIVVIYYDSRNFGNNRAETFVSISYDGGTSWQDFQVSDIGADWDGDGIPGFAGNYAGDYIGIDVFHGKVVPVWSDKRAGNMLAYTQPFEVPCPQNLNLTYGNYFITNEKLGTNFQYDAAYSAATSINVAGGSSTYKIYPNASVLMTAGDEIVLDDGFESEGEFYAYTAPCSTFSQRTENTTAPLISAPSIAPLAFNHSPVTHYQINNSVPVSPNPSNGKFILQIKEIDLNTPSELFIYNSFGQLVYQSAISNLQSAIDLSSRPRGIYFLKLQTAAGKLYTEKIIIQ